MSYAYAVWTAILILVWLIAFIGLRNRWSRRKMLATSLLTMPLGLTEPLFVPDYWNPPTLFDLAETTGFDLESLGFSFAVGGLASTLYDRIRPAHHATIEPEHRHLPGHRWHRLAISSPLVSFFVLYALDWFNPIYSAILALAIGGLFAGYCRPDLWRKMLAGAALFGLFYFAFFVSLVLSYPAYVEHVWNLTDISGILLLGVPIEEILFALSLGFLWSSAYEHITWSRPLAAPRSTVPDANDNTGAARTRDD